MSRRKITITEPAAPPDEPRPEPGASEALPLVESVIPLPPAERQARAEQALAQTQERLRALGEALATIEPRHAALAERERAATEAADLLARTLAAQPNLINAAQARLLVVAGTPAGASAQQALESTREHAERVAREEAEARAVLAATRAALAQELTQLEAEAQRAEVERQGLVGLVEHLQREVADARRAMGEEVLAVAQERANILRAEVEAAEARLAEAQAAHERHQAETAAALIAYPETLRAARQQALLPAEAPGVVEGLLVPYLAYLRALESSKPLPHMPLFDSVPLSNILGGLIAPRLHYALTSDPAVIGPHVRYVEQILADLKARGRRAG